MRLKSPEMKKEDEKQREKERSKWGRQKRRSRVRRMRSLSARASRKMHCQMQKR